MCSDLASGQPAATRSPHTLTGQRPLPCFLAVPGSQRRQQGRALQRLPLSVLLPSRMCSLHVRVWAERPPWPPSGHARDTVTGTCCSNPHPPLSKSAVWTRAGTCPWSHGPETQRGRGFSCTGTPSWRVTAALPASCRFCQPRSDPAASSAECPAAAGNRTQSAHLQEPDVVPEHPGRGPETHFVPQLLLAVGYYRKGLRATIR